MRPARLSLPLKPDSHQPNVEDSRRRRALAILRSEWLNPMADQSLHSWTLAQLGLNSNDALSDRRVRLLTSSADGWLRGGEVPLSGVADELIRKDLAIIGPVGIGKSSCVRVLVESAMQRAELDGNAPIPLPLNITTWRPPMSLEEWILRETFVCFRMPREVIRPWLIGGQITLVVDGLDNLEDELTREKFWPAIEQFRNHRPAPRVWVCATDLSATVTSSLSLQKIVELSPLTEDETAPYMRVDTASGGLLPPGRERSSRLIHIPSTPLLLNLAMLGSQDGLSAHEGTEVAADATGILKTITRFPPIVPRRVLANVARAMADLGVPDYRPTRMDTTSLNTVGMKVGYRSGAFLVGAIIGVITGIAIDQLLDGAFVAGLPRSQSAWWLQAGLVAGTVLAVAEATSIRFGSSHYIPVKRGQALRWLMEVTFRKVIPRALIALGLMGLLLLCYSIFNGIALIVGLITALVVSSGRAASPVPTLRWSWPSFLRKLLLRLALGAVVGAVVAVGGSADMGLLFGSAFALSSGLIGGFVAGFKKHLPMPRNELQNRITSRLEADVVASVLSVSVLIVLAGLMYGNALNKAMEDEIPRLTDSVLQEISAVEPLKTGLRIASTTLVVALALPLVHYRAYGGLQRRLLASMAARRWGYRMSDLEALRTPRPGMISIGDGFMFAHPEIARAAADETPTERLS